MAKDPNHLMAQPLTALLRGHVAVGEEMRQTCLASSLSKSAAQAAGSGRCSGGVRPGFHSSHPSLPKDYLEGLIRLETARQKCSRPASA